MISSNKFTYLETYLENLFHDLSTHLDSILDQKEKVNFLEQSSILLIENFSDCSNLNTILLIKKIP